MSSDMEKTAFNTEELLKKSASTDIILLIRAKEEAKKRVKDDPSATNLAALEKANKMLAEATQPEGENKAFPKIADVLAYLQKSGRKISQSQIYKDLKRGYLRRQPDKSYRQRDVDAYATMLPLVSIPEARADENEDLARTKLQEEITKIREQKLSIRFSREKEAGKYILREEVALELASRASLLGIGLRGIFRLNAPDYVRLVGGDVEKAEELAAEFEKNLDMALNEYSRPMEFSVEYIPEQDNGTDISEKSQDSNRA